ncbi:hypothetical protein LJC07_08705 [Christensenellaceae bacterium OttesenSCG-928-L17]|nr:hypothetical protein [Christensenellaceae bacterium OttesenSCG-928-L17]
MKNLLKEKLERGENPAGMFSVLGGIAAAECLGMAGLDYCIFDTEHGPGDVESVLPSVLAAERRGVAPLVRVKDSSRASVLKMLDIGAMGLVVPFINTLEEVEHLVGYAKYAPVGSRGYGIVRASGYGLADYAADTPAYFALSNRETLLLPQCETQGCLAHIEQITAMPGVDGIFVGPYDLSVALGVPGELDHPDLTAAIVRVQAACTQAGKYAFIFAGNPTHARRYLDMGYHSVTCGVDATLLAQAARDMRTKIYGA